MNDNRCYAEFKNEIVLRPEYYYIDKWIGSNSRVLDLGCGNGSLLRYLKRNKSVEEFGVEISEEGVSVCKTNGLSVRAGRADTILTDIQDDAFDYAICNVTLQMMMFPEIALAEMKRVSRFQIISFPNFAFVTQRFELMFNGVMPKRLLYHYHWFSTGHIHQCSILDFEHTIKQLGLKKCDSVYLAGKYRLPGGFMPNLFATEAIYLLQREKDY